MHTTYTPNVLSLYISIWRFIFSSVSINFHFDFVFRHSIFSLQFLDIISKRHFKSQIHQSNGKHVPTLNTFLNYFLGTIHTLSTSIITITSFLFLLCIVCEKFVVHCVLCRHAIAKSTHINSCVMKMTVINNFDCSKNFTKFFRFGKKRRKAKCIKSNFVQIY